MQLNIRQIKVTTVQISQMHWLYGLVVFEMLGRMAHGQKKGTVLLTVELCWRPNRTKKARWPDEHKADRL